MTDILHLLRCPNCGAPMTGREKSLVCGSGHCFDIAKSGYVNLLPPGKGKNARTGDDRGMVEARMNFLKRGFYGKISDMAAAVVGEYAPAVNETITVCDMGSGEGWHSCRITEKIGEIAPYPVLLAGIDASKYGAERASKLARSMNLMPREGIGAPHSMGTAAYFFPANLFHTPFADRSFSAALSMFAPIAWEEAARILDDDGVLVVVASGREHLLELRQLIYSDVRFSEDEIPVSEFFELVQRQNLRYTVKLPDKEAIADLFMMTPFYYKTSEVGKARLLAKDTLDITVDVNYTIYKKRRIPEAASNEV